MGDIQYAFRALRNSPVITAVAVLSLALGIGANTAIFSVINALVLRPLPVHHPQELVSLYTISPERADSKDPLSLAMFGQLQRQQQVFSRMFTWSGGGLSNFEIEGRKFAGSLNTVSGDYFPAMGVQPLLGRLIQPGDVSAGSGAAAPVAVMEYDCWQRLFHGDPGVVGKVIRVEAGPPLTIVGVSRPGFSGMIVDSGADVTIPASMGASRSPKDVSAWVFGRLRQGVLLEQARAQMTTLWPGVQAASRPEDYTGARLQKYLARKLDVEPASRGRSFLRERLSKPLAVLMSLVGMVLLIACVNLANLMLARSEGRRQEMAIRTALGASTSRLLRQLLTESLVLSLSGAALGIVLSIWTSRLLLRTMWTGYAPLQLDAAPDFRVLLFTTAVAIVTGILFGLAPAWRLAQTDLADALKHTSRSVRGAGLFGKTLVSLQVALSMVMVLAAALFIHSLQKMQSVDPGFQTDHLLTMRLISQAGRRRFADAVYYHDLVQKLMQLPGVTSVSYSNVGPISNGEFQLPVAAAGTSQTAERPLIDAIGPGFFQMIGMHVLRGREFNWRDDEKAAHVAVISESLSKRLFPGTDPVGRKIDLNPGVNQDEVEVVGVVNSASLWRIQSHEPLAIYTALLQAGPVNTTVDIRTAGDPRTLIPTAPRVVAAMGNQYSLLTQTLEERRDRMLAQERMTAWLSAFLGGLAMLLASIGLYGLMSYAVARRTPEIGIRMALGAEGGNILGMVMREVSLLVALGIAIGLPAALAASKWIAGMLFGLTPTDPETLALATGVLLCVALFAGYLPARHASRIDPMAALRAEG